jgi:hypothetical protein
MRKIIRAEVRKCECRIVKATANTADPEGSTKCREVAARIHDVNGQRIHLCSTHFRERIIVQDGFVFLAMSRVKPSRTSEN